MGGGGGDVMSAASKRARTDATSSDVNLIAQLVDVEGAPDGCPREHLYFNVTEWAGDVLFYPECVERCYGRCTQRCFDRYCVTNMEEPHEDEATCVPRCLQRFVEPRFVPPPPPLPNATANLTRCLLGCEGLVLPGDRTDDGKLPVRLTMPDGSVQELALRPAHPPRRARRPRHLAGGAQRAPGRPVCARAEWTRGTRGEAGGLVRRG